MLHRQGSNWEGNTQAVGTVDDQNEEIVCDELLKTPFYTLVYPLTGIFFLDQEELLPLFLLLNFCPLRSVKFVQES